MENKTVEMVVKDLLLADNQKKRKKTVVSYNIPICELSLLIKERIPGIT